MVQSFDVLWPSIRTLTGMSGAVFTSLKAATDTTRRARPGDTALFPTTARTLGLGVVVPLGQAIFTVRESQVRAPSDMIAIGDASMPGFAIIHPNFQAPVISTKPYAPHGPAFNNVFCDGHVENTKREILCEKTNGSRRRWNNDHEPHPETWQQGLNTW